MITITGVEYANLEKLHDGCYGNIYRRDDTTAYKIYNPTISSYYGGYFRNPCLKLPQKRYDQLISVSKQLQYTGGILDVVYIDNHFRGVVIPYYKSAIALMHLLEMPYMKKIDLSKQLIRNAKELHSHYVYPCDFKLDNILNDNGILQIIDLDDILTHVCYKPSYTYQNNSLNSLRWSIQRFLCDKEHLSLPKNVLNRLKRNSMQPGLDFNSIDQYISEKEIQRDILFIDSNTDFKQLAALHLDEEYDLVYVMDYAHSLFSYRMILSQLEELGISLYDFVKNTKKDKYPRCENIRSISEIQNHVLIRK